MTDPRAYTADEIRDQLINSIWSSIHFWSNPEVAPEYSISERLSGLAHSILTMLDGCSGGMPVAFKLVTDPADGDEEFLREEGENWYADGTVIEDMLHEHLYRDDLRRDR